MIYPHPILLIYSIFGPSVVLSMPRVKLLLQSEKCVFLIFESWITYKIICMTFMRHNKSKQLIDESKLIPCRKLILIHLGNTLMLFQGRNRGIDIGGVQMRALAQNLFKVHFSQLCVIYI